MEKWAEKQRKRENVARCTNKCKKKRNQITISGWKTAKRIRKISKCTCSNDCTPVSRSVSCESGFQRERQNSALHRVFDTSTFLLKFLAWKNKNNRISCSFVRERLLCFFSFLYIPSPYPLSSHWRCQIAVRVFKFWMLHFSMPVLAIFIALCTCNKCVMSLARPTSSFSPSPRSRW